MIKVVRHFHFQLKEEFNTSLATGKLEETDIAFIEETGEIWTHNKVYTDFSEYLKSSDADKTFLKIVDANKTFLKSDDAAKTYLKKGESTGNNVINVDDKGAMSNYSSNGQAYLAVRPHDKEFIINTPYAGAAFGVKLDGTAAFSHKTYTTYNKSNSTYSGAKNTAVLQFAGSVGLRYAKNTGNGTDTTEDMYKYVGVIDSPDEFQRVYSAKQVDDLLDSLRDEIDALKEEINLLKKIK